MLSGKTLWKIKCKEFKSYLRALRRAISQSIIFSSFNNSFSHSPDAFAYKVYERQYYSHKQNIYLPKMWFEKAFLWHGTFEVEVTLRSTESIYIRQPILTDGYLKKLKHSPTVIRIAREQSGEASKKVFYFMLQTVCIIFDLSQIYSIIFKTFYFYQNMVRWLIDGFITARSPVV